MIRRPPRSTQGVSSAASDVYKRQYQPPELLFDAIHSGKHVASSYMSHNHVKKDIPSSNAQPKYAESGEDSGYNPYDQFAPRQPEQEYQQPQPQPEPQHQEDKIKFKPRPNKEKLAQYQRIEEEKKHQHRPMKVYQTPEFSLSPQQPPTGPIRVVKPNLLPKPQALVQNPQQAPHYLQQQPIQPYQPPTPQEQSYQRPAPQEQSYQRPAPQDQYQPCLLYTSPSPRDGLLSRMPSSA